MFKFSKTILYFGVLFLFFSFHPAHAAPYSCSQLDNSQAVPANFGAAFNMLSPSQETLIKAQCDDDSNSATLTVGNNSSYQYIYRKAYHYDDGAWQTLYLSPQGSQTGDWLIGQARIEIALSSSDIGVEQNIAVWICTWNGSDWQCGCRDSACASPYWQLQRFTLNYSGSCIDSDNDGYDNCSPGESSDDGKTVDCDDSEYWVNPGLSATNETCDTLDNDCNGQTDEFCDSDHDGFCDSSIKIYRSNSMCLQNSVGDYINGYYGDDCNDGNSSINPDATEICDNRVDEDCDDEIDENCNSSCVENWVCADWSLCDNGTQGRSCLDNNNCGTNNDKPEENQVCMSASIYFPDDGLVFTEVDRVLIRASVNENGKRPYEYIWSSNTEGEIKRTGLNSGLSLFYSSGGSHTITFSVEDALGQIVSDSINITINLFDPCNTVCQNGFTVEEDSDCGCVDDNDCCGNGCNVGNDNDCPPDSIDWSHKILPEAWPAGGDDWMTTVKNQGACGSCWAFSAIGAMESAYNIEQNDPDLDINLSEGYVVADCFTLGDCDGGSAYTLIDYIKNEGIVSESCFSYEQRDDSCSSRCDDWSTQLWKVNSAVTCHVNSASKEFIKAQLYNYGPLTASMKINDSDCNFVDDVYKCNTTTIPNHGVVIVGYSDTEQYWIVKNSWGAGWNGNGYLKVGYDSHTSIEDWCRFYPEGVQKQ